MFLISHPRQIKNNLKQELRTKKKQKNEKSKQNKTTAGDNKNEDPHARRTVFVLDTGFVLDI